MNLNKMGGLDKLTNSERYWVGYLNRLAEQKGWTVPDELPLSSSVYLDFSLKREIARPEKLHMFLVDALMVGLHTQEKLLCLRTYAQACEYFGQLQELNFGLGSSLYDARAQLRHKVEGFFR
jgi:hypothetical protein